MRASRRAAWLAGLLLLPLLAEAGGEVAPATVGNGIDLAPRQRSVAERIAEVRRKVQEAASYPPIARKRGLEGEALVSFEIEANGSPHAAQTLQSSGSVLLDRAALAAVERAAPLPWIYGRVAVPVRFTLRDPR